MRKSHIYLFGVAFVTLGVIAAAPIAAEIQEESVSAPLADMTPDQKSQFDTWPAEQQAEYQLWPAETRAYYWTLNPDRQMLFWRLSDDDKIALTAMTGPERDNAWSTIEGRASKPPTDG